MHAGTAPVVMGVRPYFIKEAAGAVPWRRGPRAGPFVGGASAWGAFIGGRGAAFGRKVVSLPAFRPRGAASVRITAKLRIMEKEENKYVAVAYELYTTDENGAAELVEKAPAEHPFQFITGMGFALDAFEERIAALAEGSEFDFVLPVDQAYGDYEDARVLSLDRQMFCVNGHFDKDNIYPGNVITLLNEDGQHLHGMVLEVGDKEVKVDMNHPLAGRDLHFKGQVVTMRPATNDEIQGLINRMSGGGCCCGDCEGGCGGHEEGHCGHGEGHGEGHCHGGHHEDGHCCGGGHCH